MCYKILYALECGHTEDHDHFNYCDSECVQLIHSIGPKPVQFAYVGGDCWMCQVNTNSRVATERAEALNRTPATKTGIHAATTLGTVISDGPAAHVEPATGNKAFVVALKALVEQFHGSNATLATDLLFLISPEGLSMLSELTAFYQAKLSAMISDSHRDSLGSTTNQTSEPVVPAPSAPRALPPRPRASSGPGLLQPPPRRSGHQVIPYGYQASLRRTGRFEFAPGEKRVFVGTNGRVKK